MAVDDVGTPTQFLHRFQYATGIEDGTGIIVFILFTIFVCYLQAVLEVVIVSMKYTCIRADWIEATLMMSG